MTYLWCCAFLGFLGALAAHEERTDPGWHERARARRAARRRARDPRPTGPWCGAPAAAVAVTFGPTLDKTAGRVYTRPSSVGCFGLWPAVECSRALRATNTRARSLFSCAECVGRGYREPRRDEHGRPLHPPVMKPGRILR